MVTEISKIENTALRKAAEKADSQGDLNNKLDDKEMSVFVKIAYADGCKAEDITKITGTETEDETLAETLEKMSELEQKKKELETMKNQLALKEESYNNVRKDSRRFGNIVGAVTGVLGGGIGIGTLVGIGNIVGTTRTKVLHETYAFDVTNPTRAVAAQQKYDRLGKVVDAIFGKTPAGGWVRFLTVAGLFAAGGFLAGKALGKNTNVFGLKPHKAKVSEKQANDYKSNDIEPLKEQIKTLEDKIYEMENAFKAA